jgi:hypothetical protein
LFTDHLTTNQHPGRVELLTNDVGLLDLTWDFSASSFPPHHHINSPNDAPSLPPFLEGEIDTDSDVPIENEAEWLDEGPAPELTKRAPSSKTSEARAIEVCDHAIFSTC